jgi:hypothetical protein
MATLMATLLERAGPGELLLFTFVIIYVVNYIFGRLANKRIADSFLSTHGGEFVSFVRAAARNNTHPHIVNHPTARISRVFALRTRPPRASSITKCTCI